MGREIRRVPENWEHPKDERGFKPMYDCDFETKAREWMDNCRAWDDGTHSNFLEHPEQKIEYPFYWEWEGAPPDPEYYRPKFENPTHYQIYETVSEGTPVSPVFSSLEDMKRWLVESEHHSIYAAEQFCKDGWCPSGIVVPGVGSAWGIDAFDIMKNK